MRKSFVCLALAAVCCMSASAQEKLFNSASVQSPVVNKDGTVTFNLFAPKAVKVEVTGDFLPTQTIEVEGFGKYEAPGVAALKEDKNGNMKVTEVNIRHMAYAGVMAHVGFDLIEDTIKIMEDGNADRVERAPYFHYDKPYVFLRDVDVEPIILDSEEIFG